MPLPTPTLFPYTTLFRSQWEKPKKWDCQREAPEDPVYDPQEIYGILPDDIKKQFDMREIVARIVDGSRFHEYQPNYGTTLRSEEHTSELQSRRELVCRLL